MRFAISSAAVAATLACAPSTSAQARIDVAADAEIVVTGTRSSAPLRIGDSGGSITVVDAETLERRQVRELSDVLRDVPGVAVGRIAGQTQVRLRGAEGNHTLVLIDGIEVSDPFSGEFDFGTLAADDAARVEVLRGQQSAIYGSDAIGGVIQYLTATGREAPGLRGRVEAGSFGTVNAAVRAAGVAGALDYALSATINSSDGTPNARGGNRDLADDTGAASAKLTWAPGPNVRISGVARYARTRGDFNTTDNEPGSPTYGFIVDSPGRRFENEAVYALVRGEVDLLEGRWTHAASAQLADTTRDGFGRSGRTSGNEGQRLKGSYETTLRLGGGALRQALTFALDVERERFRNTDPTGFAFTGRRMTDNVGLVGQYDVLLGERAAFGASIRHDDNDRFDDTTTYRVQGSYRFDTGTRLRAAAGSGVKNPGFYELYGFIDGRFVGNPGLRPERSEGYELGIEQALAQERVTLGATYFDSVLKEEIFTTFPPPAFVATPANRATESRQRGVEAVLAMRFGTAWRIDAAYTYLHARENGVREVRRPDHVASLSASWRALANRGGATVVARYTGASRDDAYIDPSSFVPVRVRLGDYVLLNLNADVALTPRLTLFGRVENLLDERYEDVFSFWASGRSAFAGVRARY